MEKISNPLDQTQETEVSMEKQAYSWDKVKKFIQIAVAASILNGATLGTSGAAENPKDIEHFKNNLEVSKVVTAKIEKQLVDLADKKGKAGTFNINGVQYGIKVLSGNGFTVEVGYSSDGKKALWTMVESPSGDVSFLDSNNDGLVDRYVLNKNSESKKKLVDNDSYLHGDVGVIDQSFPMEVDMEKDMHHKENKILIGIFTYKNSNVSLHSYNMENGEPYDAPTSFSYSNADEVQQYFSNAIKGSLEKYH